MNAVIYARVSTEDQGDNFSIPSQFAAARRYAEERDWRVVAELSDTMSGACWSVRRCAGCATCLQPARSMSSSSTR